MTPLVVTYVSACLAFAGLGALVPTHRLRLFIPAFGVALIGYLAPVSLIWMCTLSLLAWTLMTVLPANLGRNWGAGSMAFASVGGLFFFRELDWVTALGAGYFSLRILHVVLDWWMERYEVPDLGKLLIYMLYPPVFLLGPIHRYPNFQRQMEQAPH